MITLSHYQVEPLLQARQADARVADISPDLGLSIVQVTLDARGARFPDGQFLSWEDAEVIREAENNCFTLEGGRLRKIQFYSEVTEQPFSLYPTPGAPTMLISGIPMHRIKGTDPHQDTLEKIKALKPVVGRVLDTATGLGYTAIQAARTATEVVTIELDPTALEVARLNPWSQALFDNPRITQVIGDSFEVVSELEAASFTCILHDPPAFNLAGELYSGEFYRLLYRLLRSKGRLFHYIGDPQSKSGRSITRGVTRRLEESGFRRVRAAPGAFGVVAYK